jgi:hypothetical protein
VLLLLNVWSNCLPTVVPLFREDQTNTATGIADETQQLTDAELRAYVNSVPKSELEVRVRQEDLLQSAHSILPSVGDLQYYEALGDAYNDA